MGIFWSREDEYSNKNNFMTKEEINLLLKDFKNKIILEYEQKLLNANNEIRELQKQIDTLKSMNENLKENVPNINQSDFDFISNDCAKAKLKDLSKKRIDSLVNDILKNENINIKYLPDFVEKQIYKNIFTILINLIDKLFDNISINILNHKITFDLSPFSEEKDIN